MGREETGRTAKGSYVLLIRLPQEQEVTVGRLGRLLFRPGHYAYVGSALGGLRGRLERHLRREKRTRWHIDYLLPQAPIEAIVACASEERAECRMARALAGRFEAVPGFGASDCRCRSHLFFGGPDMREGVLAAVRGIGLEPRLALGDTGNGITGASQ
jgi:Uri superfamily endonuclease